MKNPQKLQEKLVALLRNSRLHIQLPYNRPWSDLELREIAWMVEDHVNRNPEAINSDPFHDWLDEYRFYFASKND